MKKTYVTPEVEKIAFQYRDQVVAASGCLNEFAHTGVSSCDNEQNQGSLN